MLSSLILDLLQLDLLQIKAIRLTPARRGEPDRFLR
jgi:hypothetical protein